MYLPPLGKLILVSCKIIGIPTNSEPSSSKASIVSKIKAGRNLTESSNISDSSYSMRVLTQKNNSADTISDHKGDHTVTPKDFLIVKVDELPLIIVICIF